MQRPIINLQGSLANPNVALEAAKRHDLASIPSGPTGRIDARAVRDAMASGVSATCITVGHVAGDGDPFEMTQSELQDWHRFLCAPDAPLALVRHAADLGPQSAGRKPGLILGFQNTEMLGGDSSRVAHFAQLGVRVMQLTYNGANAVGFGCMCAHDPGITPFGREAIDCMNRSGVLVDLSHAGPGTMRTAIQASKRPVAVSHSACRSLTDHPRNLWDEDLRMLADRAGVVGIYAMPFLRESGQPHMEDYIRHLEHALKVAGQDHVAVGTDGTITAVDDVATYRHYLNEAVQSRKAAGVGASGEDGAIALFLPDMTGPTQFEVLAHQLSRRGHPESTIDKLLGLNWQRLLTDAWSAES